ncbi:putative toxin-antitoxin system toxin component, PIN family [Treponema sp. Marseille-Q4130]|uniref:putative toxin-antitoxin system toxin component, PIN family n=1 Tax=Treponema sp. Marseille-Q4130 TaxID=2766702 RepID=UPI001651CE17|nr:putative toxin-antitoxin system toxin component, PIN family [Treponema sp. Marseille-Q4130]MBC6720688.1 putative toxin-antitoxin system toxin component, PIN family [Treponema sp. Marseille-Q4130]
MKKYVVIDTNVLVSALITRNENAPTVKILKYLSQNKIVPVYSSNIVKEYYEVLRREKFKLSDEIVSALLIKDIVTNGLEVRNVVEVNEEMPDSQDIVFYAVTLTTRDKDTFLVTGNGKHFPAKSFIITPAELVDILEKN